MNIQTVNTHIDTLAHTCTLTHKHTHAHTHTYSHPHPHPNKKLIHTCTYHAQGSELGVPRGVALGEDRTGTAVFAVA
jgi:hypothetical protein